MSKRIGIVQRTGTGFVANFFPHQTRGIDDGTINNWTRNITKQTDGKLNDAHGHRFIYILMQKIHIIENKIYI